MSNQTDNPTAERFTTRFSDGEIVTNEGPGQGYASYPWALDQYERALGLTPQLSWLIKRMIKHVWKSGGVCFVSMSGVCREALISRPTLDGLIKALLTKGYIQEVDRGHVMFDHRVRYDVSGVFLALSKAIRCDPQSKWAQQNGGPRCMADFFTHAPPEFKSFSEPDQVNTYYAKRGFHFNWCEGKTEPWDRTVPNRQYSVTCEDCGAVFDAGAPNAKYCPPCREERRRARWDSFKGAFGDLAREMDDEE